MSPVVLYIGCFQTALAFHVEIASQFLNREELPAVPCHWGSVSIMQASLAVTSTVIIKCSDQHGSSSRKLHKIKQNKEYSIEHLVVTSLVPVGITHSVRHLLENNYGKERINLELTWTLLALLRNFATFLE